MKKFILLLIGLMAINLVVVGKHTDANTDQLSLDKLATIITPSIIYVSPRFWEVYNPLDIRTATVYISSSDMRGMSIKELFKFVEKKPDNFVILRVVRETSHTSHSEYLWFLYIDR